MKELNEIVYCITRKKKLLTFKFIKNVKCKLEILDLTGSNSFHYHLGFLAKATKIIHSIMPNHKKMGLCSFISLCL